MFGQPKRNSAKLETLNALLTVAEKVKIQRQTNEAAEYVHSEVEDLMIDTETENEVFAIWWVDPEEPNEAYNKKKGQIVKNKEDNSQVDQNRQRELRTHQISKFWST
uniref:Uncharacterized protein n=1 Tax=Caenorhabditis japonica TaxID=281687 RepID=A0A8R1I510_CAEJA